MIQLLFSVFMVCAHQLDCETEVDQYLKYLYQNMQHKYYIEAQVHVPIVVSESLAQNIDPLLVAVIIYTESSWRHTALGKAGEVGLMQVLPRGRCGQGQDLSTPQGQVRAGVRCLRISIDRCGSVRKGLNMFACGACSNNRRAAYKWRVYQKALNLIRKKDEQFKAFIEKIKKIHENI